MKRAFLASAAVLLLSVSASFAQGSRYGGQPSNYGPYSRPALSPALNLIRGGDPAANYYLGVIPERDRRATGIQYGAELQELDQRMSRTNGDRGGDLPRLGPTGHSTFFLNHSTYYNFGGSRAAPSGPPAATQRRTR